MPTGQLEARDKIEREIGAETLAVQCDVRKLEDVQRLIGATRERFGTIHILVNNAGSVPAIKFSEVSDQQWYDSIERKLMGFLRVAREVVPEMQKSGWGRIVNVAGTAGWEPSNSAMAVGINNAAVINWTKSMSLQYAIRKPGLIPRRTAARKSRPVTGCVSGANGLGPHTACRMSATSSALRAIGPVTCSVSHT